MEWYMVLEQGTIVVGIFHLVSFLWIVFSHKYE